jgi:5-methylcytosine-specific restriction endonuclease McrA
VCVRDRTRRWRRDNPNYTPPPRNPEKSREWSRRWRRNNPDKVRSATATRRARRVAATVETFSVKEIFERDDWDCHICRQPIDRDLSYPDPGSASLDHVIPLSKGGPHSRHNCRAAHLTCNLRKQARLVGSSNG